MEKPLKVLVVDELPNLSEIHLSKTYWVKGNVCPKCEARILSYMTTKGPYYGDIHGGYIWAERTHDCVAYLSQRIKKLEEIVARIV